VKWLLIVFVAFLVTATPKENKWKTTKVIAMQHATSGTVSAQRSVEHPEELDAGPQPEETDLDLRRHLQTFRRAHPYREVQVAGRRWRYIVGGQGERTLLLLPGSLVPDLFFIPIEVLERDFRVIVPAYAAVPTMVALVAGVAAILDTEGMERVDVIGSSFGGYVAQCFVRAYPARVDRLILAETGVRHFVSWAPSIALLARLMNVLPARLVRFLMWRLWSTLFTPPTSQRAFWGELMQEILTTQLSKANFVSETKIIADFSAHYHFSSGDLAAWSGKILILESERDEAYRPANRARTRAVYPQARMHTIRNATHSAIATHTEEYIRTMREFLAEH
jgi:pimeloyl-ACP methyl ester carboxylesterase